MRISNFLLWQLAYTEIYVTEVLWPDFKKQDLYKALIDYQKRLSFHTSVSGKSILDKKAQQRGIFRYQCLPQHADSYFHVISLQKS